MSLEKIVERLINGSSNNGTWVFWTQQEFLEKNLVFGKMEGNKKRGW